MLRRGTPYHSGYLTQTRYVIQEAEGWRELDPDSVTAEYARVTGKSPIIVEFTFRSDRVGIWHPLIRSRTELVQFTRGTDGKSIDDVDDRAAIFDELERNWQGSIPPSKRAYWLAGGGTIKSFQWLGLLGDLSVIAAICIAVYAFRRVRRFATMKADGHCEYCGYDLTGVRSESCPDCGMKQSEGSRS